MFKKLSRITLAFAIVLPNTQVLKAKEINDDQPVDEQAETRNNLEVPSINLPDGNGGLYTGDGEHTKPENPDFGGSDNGEISIIVPPVIVEPDDNTDNGNISIEVPDIVLPGDGDNTDNGNNGGLVVPPIIIEPGDGDNTDNGNDGELVVPPIIIEPGDGDNTDNGNVGGLVVPPIIIEPGDGDNGGDIEIPIPNPGDNGDVDQPVEVEEPEVEVGIESKEITIKNVEGSEFYVVEADIEHSRNIAKEIARRQGLDVKNIYTLDQDGKVLVYVYEGELETNGSYGGEIVVNGVYYSTAINSLTTRKNYYNNDLVLISGNAKSDVAIPVGKKMIGLNGNTLVSDATVNYETMVVRGVNFKVESLDASRMDYKAAVLRERGANNELHSRIRIVDNTFDFGEKSLYAMDGIAINGGMKSLDGKPNIVISNNEFFGNNKGSFGYEKRTNQAMIRMNSDSDFNAIVEISNNKIKNSAYCGIQANDSGHLIMENNELDQIDLIGIWVQVVNNPEQMVIKNNMIKSYGLRKFETGGIYGRPVVETNAYEKGIHVKYNDTVYGVNVNDEWFENGVKLANNLVENNKITPEDKNNELDHVVDCTAASIEGKYRFYETSKAINEGSNFKDYSMTIVKDNDENATYGVYYNGGVTVGNLRIVGNGGGLIHLPATLTVLGDLIIDCPNAVLKNSATVNGNTNVIRIKSEDKSSFTVPSELELIRQGSKEDVVISLKDIKDMEGNVVSSDTTNLSNLSITTPLEGKETLVLGTDYTVNDETDEITIKKEFLNSLTIGYGIVNELKISLTDETNNILEATKKVDLKLVDHTDGRINFVLGQETSFYYQMAKEPIKVQITGIKDMSGKKLSPQETTLKGNVEIHAYPINGFDDSLIEIDDENDIISIMPKFLNWLNTTKYMVANELAASEFGDITVTYEDLEHNVGIISDKVHVEVLNASDIKIERISAQTFVEGEAPLGGIVYKIIEAKDTSGKVIPVSELNLSECIAIEPFPFCIETDGMKLDWGFNDKLFEINNETGEIIAKKSYLDTIIADDVRYTDGNIKAFKFKIRNSEFGINYNSPLYPVFIKSATTLDDDVEVVSFQDQIKIESGMISSGDVTLNKKTTIEELNNLLVTKNERITKRVYRASNMKDGKPINPLDFKDDYEELEEGDVLVITAENGEKTAVYEIKLESTLDLELAITDKTVVNEVGYSFIEVYAGKTANEVANALGNQDRFKVLRNQEEIGSDEVVLSNDVLFDQEGNKLYVIHTIGDAVYRAIAIGNADYEGEGSDLEGPVYDVDLMNDVFNEQTFEDNTKFKSIDVYKNVRKDDFLNHIKESFKDAKDTDVSYIYYSGHGNLVEGKAYICTVNEITTTQDNGTLQDYVNEVEEKWVSVEQLKQVLDTIPGTKVVILDSCNSGGFIGKNKDKSTNTLDPVLRTLKKDLPMNKDFGPAVINEFQGNYNPMVRSGLLTTNEYKVLTAASADEYSFEDGGSKYGKFTKILAKATGHGVEGNQFLADANGDKIATLEELHQYLTHNVEYQSHIQAFPRHDTFGVFAKLGDTEDPTDPTEPVKPVDPTDPVEPTVPTDPVEPVDPTDPVEPVDPTDPVEPTDPTDPVEPVDPVKPEVPTTDGTSHEVATNGQANKQFVQPYAAPYGSTWNALTGQFDAKPGFKWDDSKQQYVAIDQNKSSRYNTPSTGDKGLTLPIMVLVLSVGVVLLTSKKLRKES